MKYSPLIVASVLMLGGFLAHAAPDALATEPKPPVEVIDEVIVPVPREVFAALDELGPVNWAALIRQPDYQVQADRPATALVFGAVIAEGFIAVQAKDEDATKKLGPKVLELAELLGVKEAVNAHAKAIVDSADKGDWDGVRRELDRTQATVRRTMQEMRDDDLAQFVSMGGWLRGTEAAAAAVAAAYSADSAELLHQPGLVAHFQRSVGKLDAKAEKLAAFKRIRKELPQLEELMRADTMPRESVEKIRALCAGMVATMLGNNAEVEKGATP
jgi:hypothetical protein